MTAPRVVEHVVCLGCGCTCDDIAVTVQNGRILETARACPMGKQWFGDGTLPAAIRRDGHDGAIEEALAEAAAVLLAARGRLLVYVGADLTSEAQRVAVALADQLGAVLDTATSENAAAGFLAAQRRGRAAATLGEIRNRADVLLFWAVDPSVRYPRYNSRYALDPVGTQVPGGRAGRTVISVSVGADRGPSEAELELTLAPEEEISALSVMRATVLGNSLGELPPRLQQARELARKLTQAGYAVLVHDGEPQDEPRDPLRSEGLIALAQALNGPTRAALSTLRAGGNPVGVEAVLTWQTGYPMAVDFSRGAPRYGPGSRGLERLLGGGLAAALVIGTVAALSSEAAAGLGRVPTVLVGPRASTAPFRPRVSIDTGVAGIHEGGVAYRMDEVPLPLRPPLAGEAGPQFTETTLRRLLDAVRGSPKESSR